MPLFKAWVEGDGDQDSATELMATDDLQAAQRFADRHYMQADYPKEFEVCVQQADGVEWLPIVRFDVKVRMEPDFHVTRKMEPSPA